MAVAAVIVLATVNALGVRSTARFSGVVVAVVLAGLCALLLLVALWAAQGGVRAAEVRPVPGPDAGWLGIVQSAGLLFFCFAGYARMATLGEEVREPRHTLPRAILGALAIALLLYAPIGAPAFLVLGPVVVRAGR